MNRFPKGFFVGIGIGLVVVLGALIVLGRDEKMRHLARERLEGLRNSLPESEQLKRSGQQVAARVSETTSQLKDIAQQAAAKVRETGSALGDLAQQSASQVKQTGQDVASTIKQTATPAEQSDQTGTTS
ncbi:MAG: hypothetical protein ACJ797_22825 [Ktedonobacteraceae bacterium]